MTTKHIDERYGYYAAMPGLWPSPVKAQDVSLPVTATMAFVTFGTIAVLVVGVVLLARGLRRLRPW